jgi:hypothetical protein
VAKGRKGRYNKEVTTKEHPMERQEFLKVYHQLKGSIIAREDNQFAEVCGDLVSVEVYDSYNYDAVEGIITTTESGNDIGEYDLYHESLPTEYNNSLMVVYYRDNTVTTRLDFYNNRVEVAPYDLLASWQTEYYLTNSKGELSQVEVYNWNGANV